MGDRNLKRAFALDDDIPDGIDLNSVPRTGMHYLYQVRLETRRCPKVVVADIDTTQFANQQTVRVDTDSGFIVARPGYVPDPDWQQIALDEFHSTKTKLIENRDMLKGKFTRRSVPKINQAKNWCLYCLGSECHKRVYPEDSPLGSSDTERSPKRSRISSDGNPPLLSVIVHLDQNRVKKLLSYFDVWLSDIDFSKQVGKWMYTLLVALEKPLDPDSCSLLRSLSRHCSRFRDGLLSSEDPLLKPLNAIIYIIAHYFDQKDLCDTFIIED